MVTPVKAILSYSMMDLVLAYSFSEIETAFKSLKSYMEEEGREISDMYLMGHVLSELIKK